MEENATRHRNVRPKLLRAHKIGPNHCQKLQEFDDCREFLKQQRLKLLPYRCGKVLSRKISVWMEEKATRHRKDRPKVVRAVEIRANWSLKRQEIDYCRMFWKQ